MITLFLILLPLAGLLAVWCSGNSLKLQAALLNIGAALHCIGVALLWIKPEWDNTLPANITVLIGQDVLSRTVLTTISVLFLLSSLQTVKYFPMVRKHFAMRAEKFLSPQLVVICLLGFLSSMTLVASSRNFGLLWVAMEATTLASAPLIIFNRNGDSLEAMWKYILICSVGIGFALFGTMLLAISGQATHAGMDMALLGMSKLDPMWFKAAFVFMLAGYGTKMGLAPFHSWMPDAYSEAPGVLSVLSSGALLACSFLGVARVLEVAPAEAAAFCRQLMMALGLLSLALAAFFIIRQQDYKRMLAYSSMEHMGLTALLWALDLQTVALLHIIVHALLKVVLFMTADNIQLACGTQKINSISGLLGVIRRNGIIYLIAVLMLCGMPPSPLFITEMYLVAKAGPILGAVILLLLFVVFAGMTYHVMRMTMGRNHGCVIDGKEIGDLEKLTVIPGGVLSVCTVGGILLIAALAAFEFV
ncbi:MAG: hypothetical protein E7056_00700 [Lentisphaerae bacterium]|nr:hypothetical protein [Lentisphaerota bacterium]